MSDEQATTTALATPADPLLDTGLEDFAPEDMVVPRLSIVHADGVFEDSLTGEQHTELKVVLLGLVKGRILWPAEVGESGDAPLCKSFNHSDGHPGENFPLEASGFDELPPEGGTLPCSDCLLKDWDSHPTRDTPWCAEQHTFPLLMETREGFTAPAILTLQRSALKASKTYMTAFARSRTPLFTVVTNLGLDGRKRGSVVYQVPRLTKVADTDDADYLSYAENYRSIRDFLTTPRSLEAEAEPEHASAPGTSQVAEVVDDDDDIPF